MKPKMKPSPKAFKVKVMLLIYSLFLAIVFCREVHGQSPNAFSFQSVLRNNAGSLISNQSVALRISVLQGSESGISVYSETHQSNTNDQGLLSVQIGGGQVSQGQFNQINWSAGPYFVKTEVDPLGGTNYSITDLQQFLSVPYALYAATSGNPTSGPQGEPGPMGPTGATGATGPGACETISNGNTMVVWTPTMAYGISQSQSSSNVSYNAAQYTPQILSGTPIGAVSSERQIVLYTSTHAYCFRQSQSAIGPSYNQGTWSVQPLSGVVIGALASKINTVVFTSTNAYGFAQSQSTLSDPPILNSGTWVSQILSGAYLGSKANARSIAVFTNSGIYTFYQTQSATGNPPAENNGLWSVQNLNDAPVDAISTK